MMVGMMTQQNDNANKSRFPGACGPATRTHNIPGQFLLPAVLKDFLKLVKLKNFWGYVMIVFVFANKMEKTSANRKMQKLSGQWQSRRTS